MEDDLYKNSIVASRRVPGVSRSCVPPSTDYRGGGGMRFMGIEKHEDHHYYKNIQDQQRHHENLLRNAERRNSLSRQQHDEHMNLQHREQLQRFRLLSESTMASSTQSRLSQQTPSGSKYKYTPQQLSGQQGEVNEQNPEETSDDDNELLMRKIVAARLDIHAGLVNKRQPSIASPRSSNGSNGGRSHQFPQLNSKASSGDTNRQPPPRVHGTERSSLRGIVDFVPNNIEDENDPFIMKVLANRSRHYSNQSTTPGNNANTAPETSVDSPPVDAVDADDPFIMKILAERSRVLHNEEETQVNAPRSLSLTADIGNSTTSILSESNHDIVMDATVKNIVIDEVTALNDRDRSSLIVNGTEDTQQGLRPPPRKQREEQIPGAFAVAGPGFDTSSSTTAGINALLMRRPSNLTSSTIDAMSFVSSDTLLSNRSNDIETPDSIIASGGQLVEQEDLEEQEMDGHQQEHPHHQQQQQPAQMQVEGQLQGLSDKLQEVDEYDKTLRDCAWMIFVSCATIVVVVVVAVTVSLVLPKSDNAAPDGSNDIDEELVMGATFETREAGMAAFRNSLPDFTWQKIQQDQSSPQATAYKWVSDDPFLAGYPLWRAHQRFALATVYFTFASGALDLFNEWVLSYNVSECDMTLSRSTNEDACDPATGMYERLFLDDMVEGTLPPEVAMVSSLKTLAVTRTPQKPTEISVFLPFELTNLSQLTHLTLSSGNLQGSIPSMIGLMASLEVLELSLLHLSGTLPTFLGQLTNLQELMLFDNSLTGALPDELAHLENLWSLWINNNRLEGSLPATWSSMRMLNSMDMQSNMLTGTLPLEWGRLAAMIDLQLSSNFLTGTIPPEWEGMASLKTLGLNGMNITGVMPDHLCERAMMRPEVEVEIDCRKIRCCEWDPRTDLYGDRDENPDGGF